MVIFVLKTQSRRSPVPVSRTQPKRPHTPKPDLTMPAAPRPTALCAPVKPKPDLPPPAEIFIFIIFFDWYFIIEIQVA